MPGAPVAGKAVGFNPVCQKYVSEVTNPDVQFAVFVADAAANNPNGAFGASANYQAYNDAKARLQAEYGSLGFNAVVLQYPERDGYQGGRGYHEVTYKVMPGYNYNSW